MRAIILGAALPLLLAGAAAACPDARQASAPMVLADNAATSTPAPANGDSAKKPDTVAFPNSPNGSPAAGDKGQPVVTDKAACTGTGPTATCGDSPKPSNAADTSDVAKTTPTTVDGTAPKK
ncbi:hypothetical protein [Lichenibacterium dinghuense]|uniref:hypothetical protein n=1 Tax=Lichenibacterium dinghuense TaxID=2895977 RepID=UPI001F2F0322|nr:hypothetical protein [Lichenibacterium sp. 6Y81]